MQLIQIAEPNNTKDKEYMKFTCLVHSDEGKNTIRLSLVKINDSFAVTKQSSKSCTACVDEEEIIHKADTLVDTQLCYQAHLLDILQSKYKIVKHEIISLDLKDEQTIPKKHFQ